MHDKPFIKLISQIWPDFIEKCLVLVINPRLECFLILAASHEFLRRFWLVTNNARSANGSRRCILQMRAVDDKLHLIRDPQNLSRWQTETASVIKDAIKIFDPFWEDNSLDVDDKCFFRRGCDVFSDLLGEISVLEDSSSGVGGSVDLLDVERVDVYLFYLVLRVDLFYFSHGRALVGEDVAEEDDS